MKDSNATGVNGNQADNSAADAGAAYVFLRTGTTWNQEAYLKASNTGAGDIFGVSVAVFADTVVVGANHEFSNATGVNGNQTDNSAGDAGAAYVFVRTGTTWSQEAYLKASNTGENDQFGESVAVFCWFPSSGLGTRCVKLPLHVSITRASSNVGISPGSRSFPTGFPSPSLGTSNDGFSLTQ